MTEYGRLSYKLTEGTHIADIKMRIFNKNGTEEEISGNGIRCFARYGPTKPPPPIINAFI